LRKRDGLACALMIVCSALTSAALFRSPYRQVACFISVFDGLNLLIGLIGFKNGHAFSWLQLPSGTDGG
jgi:hypothetical protein